MKKIFILFTVALLTLSCEGQTKFSADALPYKLITTDAKVMTFEEVLKKNEGKTLVIEVWASWCGDCVKNMPKLKELQANNPEVTYIFLSVDKTAEAWKKGIDKHELKGEHYLISDGMKGSFGKAINLDWIPRYIIVDKKGEIALYKAIETDFDKINTTLKQIK
jgi:thiol-disulfide isomerase/thioredoxin